MNKEIKYAVMSINTLNGYGLSIFDTFEEAQKIRAFLSDESNIGNCDECAYNEGYDRRYPCGQFRCSVEVHCTAAAECEDDEK